MRYVNTFVLIALISSNQRNLIRWTSSMHLCQSVIWTSTSYLDRSHDRTKYSHDVFRSISRENTRVQAYLCENCGDHVVLERFGSNVARGGLERLYRSLEQGTFQRKGFNLRWMHDRAENATRATVEKRRKSAQKFITAWGKGRHLFRENVPRDFL